MDTHILLWGGFLLFVAAMLALDLGVFHRKAHVVHMREAVAWTAAWITLALLFNAGIAYFWGRQAGVEFLTGYLVEKSLSMDNVFVYLLIFNYFNTPPAYQHKVLFWGIIGAIVFRSIFIVAGLAVLETFHWSLYGFGIFLLGTLIATGILALSLVMPGWAAALIVSGVLLLIIAILVGIALANFRRGSEPLESIESVRQDIDAITGRGAYGSRD